MKIKNEVKKKKGIVYFLMGFISYFLVSTIIELLSR